MFSRFFIITVLFAVLLWYAHEYFPTEFIAVTRSVPYVAPLMRKLHLWLGTKGSKLQKSPVRLFTPEELKEFSGEKNSKGIYISILGQVYDVSKGEKHYGPGGTYHIFAGRDSSRSFVTGDFSSKSGTDDVLDLSASELLSLKDWALFYKNEYTYKGKLIGKYYDKLGEKTKYSLELDEKFNQANNKKKSERDNEILFPPCNAEWDTESGTRVWCSSKSGGINRDWVGVPRKLYKVGSDTFRCACVNLEDLKNPDSLQYARRGHLQLYEDCDPDEASCFVEQ